MVREDLPARPVGTPDTEQAGKAQFAGESDPAPAEIAAEGALRNSGTGPLLVSLSAAHHANVNICPRGAMAVLFPAQVPVQDPSRNSTKRQWTLCLLSNVEEPYLTTPVRPVGAAGITPELNAPASQGPDEGRGEPFLS